MASSMCLKGKHTQTCSHMQISWPCQFAKYKYHDGKSNQTVNVLREGMKGAKEIWYLWAYNGDIVYRRPSVGSVEYTEAESNLLQQEQG